MRFIALLAIFCLMISPLRAQSPFNMIIRSALDNDKDIRSQQAAGEASVTFNDVEGPQIEYEHQWPTQGDHMEGKWVLSITQDFDWPGLYAARSKVGALERTNASLVLMAITADRALSIKLLIIDIVNSHRRHELYNQVAVNLSLVDSLTRVAYDRGAATSLDLWKMKLALLENKYSIANAESDIRALEGSLAATGATFINGEAEFWHDYPIQSMINPADADPNSLSQAILQNSAALGAARVKATKLEAVPGFSAGYLHAYEEGIHFNGLRVGLRLPSFSQKKKNKIAMLEAESILYSSQYEQDKQQAEMHALYEEASTLSKALASYRDLTGNDSYLQLLDKSFKAGQITVIDYLNEINLFITARIAFLDLEYRYNLTLAKLNRYRSLDF